MAYDEIPKKPIKASEGRMEYNHDECIRDACDAGRYGDRTDASSQGVGYLGVDDLDRIRRENLKHKTR